jgi:hypothetical protein
MSALWPGDSVSVRSYPIGTLNLKRPELHPSCTVCGCDCTERRVEFYGFVPLGATGQVELVMITTCMDHWHEPLAARLRAAS